MTACNGGARRWGSQGQGATCERTMRRAGGTPPGAARWWTPRGCSAPSRRKTFSLLNGRGKSRLGPPMPRDSQRASNKKCADAPAMRVRPNAMVQYGSAVRNGDLASLQAAADAALCAPSPRSPLAKKMLQSRYRAEKSKPNTSRSAGDHPARGPGLAATAAPLHCRHVSGSSRPRSLLVGEHASGRGGPIGEHLPGQLATRGIHRR